VNAKPYQDLLVVDLTTTIAGPYCTRLLADLGADVIKVETPEGDMMRTRPPIPDGYSRPFGQLNAGKRSVVLDLKQPEGAEALRRLVARADLLVENFRPGVMAKLGLDYASLAEINPRLVYCAISGYGQTGPSAGAPAYAPVVHAASGFDLAHLAYQDNRERPDWCGLFIADVLAGLHAFAAIGPALRLRDRTGQGQFIDVSMFEAMLGLCLNEVQLAQAGNEPPARLFGPTRTADGYVMAAVASEKSFVALCQAAGRPELVTDPRFERYIDRRRNWHLFVEEIERWSTTLTTAECMAVLDRHGVPASPYRTVAEALRDPQLELRGALATVRDPAGEYKVLNAPFRISGTDVSAAPRAPALGEHTREVLESLGIEPSSPRA
jgi:crotonobetainyl-CoA:carnitine CoA-transferase CaiB-like acyl-CoA transferase